jgi:O-antigen ligase
LFCFYVAIGPVYWLPGVPTVAITLGKMALFVAAMVLPVVGAAVERKIFFPGGRRAFLVWLALLLLAVPSVLYGDAAAGAYRIFNVVQIAVFLAMSGYILHVWPVARVGGLIAAYFVATIAVAAIVMIALPNVPNPFGDASVLRNTGLGSKRTGWSTGIALFLPWLIVAGANRARLAGALATVGNQLLVVGRAGLLASFVVITMRYGRSWKGRLGLVAAMVAIVLAFEGDQLLAFFRVASTSGADLLSYDALNLTSAGRLAQYHWALQQVASAPFFGAGVGNALYTQTLESTWSPAVHNEWLRLAAESGLLFVLAAAWLVFALLGPQLGRRLEPGSAENAAKLTVVAALIVSLLEPIMFFGAFNNCAVAWFALACCATGTDTEGQGD